MKSQWHPLFHSELEPRPKRFQHGQCPRWLAIFIKGDFPDRRSLEIAVQETDVCPFDGHCNSFRLMMWINIKDIALTVSIASDFQIYARSLHSDFSRITTRWVITSKINQCLEIKGELNILRHPQMTQLQAILENHDILCQQMDLWLPLTLRNPHKTQWIMLMFSPFFAPKPTAFCWEKVCVFGDCAQITPIRPDDPTIIHDGPNPERLLPDCICMRSHCSARYGMM